MAEFRSISPSFWTDTKVEDEFTPGERYFYLYLLTNPHTNLCGCYEVSVSQMKRESGLSEEIIAKTLDSLEKKHKVIVVDRSTNEIYIPKWGRYNWCNSTKTAKGALRELPFIKSETLRMQVKHVLDTLFSTKIPYFEQKYHITEKNTIFQNEIGYRGGTIGGYIEDTCNNNSSKSNNDSNLEDGSISGTKKATSPTKKVRSKYTDSPEFKAFWDAYPKHQGKTVARQSFERVDVPLQVLLDAIEEQKHSKQWTKDDGEYIPLPSTWLNQRRWEDSMKVDVPKSDGMERYSNLQRLAEEFENE